MAQQWAQWFYASPAWRRCRRLFLATYRTCERCGRPSKIAHHRVYLTPDNIGDPLATLHWGNLEPLCMRCHGREHNEVVVESTRPGFAFDADGNLVQRVES